MYMFCLYLSRHRFIINTRSLDPSVLGFILSLYRHRCKCILFISRFTSYFNKPSRSSKPWSDVEDHILRTHTLPMSTFLSLTSTLVLCVLTETNPHRSRPWFSKTIWMYCRIWLQKSNIHIPTLPIPTILSLTCTQVSQFLKIYLKEDYDFFGGIDV